MLRCFKRQLLARVRRAQHAPVGRERLNEDANKKYHTLESDEAVLRDTLRRYDDIRSLKLRVLSRVTKGTGEAQNEHSTLQKPRPVPRRVSMSK